MGRALCLIGLAATLAVPAGCGRKAPAVVIRFAPGPWLGKLSADPLPTFSKARPQIALALASERQGADVMILDGFDLADAIRKKELFNLLPTMEERFFDLRQFKEADVRRAGRVDGFYGLPVGGGGPTVICYNADLFAKEGLPLPDKRWEWGDFLEAAQKLTKDLDHDGKTDRYGFVVEPTAEAALPWVWQAGGRLANLDDEKALDGFRFYADLTVKHKVSPTPDAAGGTAPVDLFAQQRAAMVLVGPESLAKLKAATFAWDIQVPPKGPAGSATTLRQFFCAVAKDTQHPEEAWDLVEFLTSAYVGVAVGQSGLLPARCELLGKFDFGGAEVSLHRAVWSAAYDVADHVPYLMACDERGENRIGQQLRKLLEGKASPEETAKAAAQTVAELRKKLE